MHAEPSGSPSPSERWPDPDDDWTPLEGAPDEGWRQPLAPVMDLDVDDPLDFYDP